jgi:regulator of protease activity HflC (stomatin/prohibitin superfamily)
MMGRVGAVFAAGLVVFGVGWGAGAKITKNAYLAKAYEAQVAQVAAAREIAKAESERLAAQAAYDAQIQTLEAEAYAQVSSDSCVLDVERVRRLNLR